MEHVGKIVPRSVNISGAGKHEVLDVRRERVSDRGKHGVCALVRGLYHQIIRAVDHIGVIARATGKGVGSALSIEQVVACIATQNVVERVTASRKIRVAGQR